MRPLGVVVVHVDAQHPFEVAAVQDQQPVETVGARGADEAFCDRVSFRRSYRGLPDPNPLAAEDLVEGAAVFAVAVADQEADALLREIQAEVTRLLGYPSAGGVGRAAGEPNAAAVRAMKNSA
jgi:hypothetical protein